MGCEGNFLPENTACHETTFPKEIQNFDWCFPIRKGTYHDDIIHMVAVEGICNNRYEPNLDQSYIEK